MRVSDEQNRIVAGVVAVVQNHPRVSHDAQIYGCVACHIGSGATLSNNPQELWAYIDPKALILLVQVSGGLASVLDGVAGVRIGIPGIFASNAAFKASFVARVASMLATLMLLLSVAATV